MKTEITIIKEEHKLTSDEKIKHWGYGEWVEEVDVFKFTYMGYEALIRRVFVNDGPTGEHLSGGHLCGYVEIPSDHPLYGKDYESFNIDTHFGLTFNSFLPEETQYMFEQINCHWIGFDCAHYGDLMPSFEKLKQTIPELIEIEKKYPFTFTKIYRNFQFCIDNCISMIDQLEQIKVKGSCEQKDA